MSKGMKRFFIICAIVCGIGLVMGGIGYAVDGVKYFDKVAEKYSWLHGNPGERTYKKLDEQTSFQDIVIKGDMDVVIRTGDSSKTRISYGEKLSAPVLKVENGTLIADARYSSGNGVSINFTEDSGWPILEVYCPKGTRIDSIKAEVDCSNMEINDLQVKKMTIENKTGTITMNGVSWEQAELEIDSGNLELANVTSKGLQLEADTVDCVLNGTFAGKTAIEVESGDLDLDTMLAEADYRIDAEVDSGILCIGDHYKEDYEGHYRFGDGTHQLNIKGDVSDVTVRFSGKAADGSSQKEGGVSHDSQHGSQHHDESSEKK